MSTIDMSQYWNYVFIPSVVLLLLYLIYAIVSSRGSQIMGPSSVNAYVNSIGRIGKNIR